MLASAGAPFSFMAPECPAEAWQCDARRCYVPPRTPCPRALSSAVERLVYTEDAGGSNPSAPIPAAVVAVISLRAFPQHGTANGPLTGNHNFAFGLYATAGRAVMLDPSGALVLEGPQGRTVHHAGDVEHLRPQ